MPVRSRLRQGTAGPGVAGRRSLLGSFPRPALHLVGTPLSPKPGSPSHWQPPLPPPQYGIDYSFLQHHRGHPLRWQPGLAIAVRITGPHLPGQAVTVAAVAAELAALVGITLSAGEPWPHALPLHAVPAQELHISFSPALPPALPFAPCAGQAGLGGAVAAHGMGYYTSGLVAIDSGRTSPHPARELAVVRHELAHALGLGHVARPSLLMHRRAASADYGHGDRHGLIRLYQALPAPARPAFHPDGKSYPCAI